MRHPGRDAGNILHNTTIHRYTTTPACLHNGRLITRARAPGSQRCQIATWPTQVMGCAYTHIRQTHIADQSHSRRYTLACTLTPHVQKTHQAHTTVSFDNQVSGDGQSSHAFRRCCWPLMRVCPRYTRPCVENPDALSWRTGGNVVASTNVPHGHNRVTFESEPTP